MQSTSTSLEQSALYTVSAALEEVPVNVQDAYNRGLVDINFFASIAIPETFLYDFPQFYVLIWSLLTKAPTDTQVESLVRFALGLPRGHAKTTFVKVLIAWLICYDRVRFVLIVCANEPLAEQLLADINDIMGSSNIEAIYGNWTSNISTDKAELKKVMYHSKPFTLAARGAGSSLRGLNIKNNRPDLIFCDDVQTRENDESPTDRARLLRWLGATLFKTIDPRGHRLIIYLGNMYSEDCILRQFQKSPYWTSLVTGAILANGKALWPQLHSIKTLMESYFHDEVLGLGALWFAEMMNDPVNPATSLLAGGELPRYEFKMGEEEYDACFLTVDPAGMKKNSDSNAIVVHYIKEDSGVVVEASVGIKDPEQLIIETLKLAMFHGACLIAVEDVAYQSTLQFWFNKYIEAWQLEHLAVVPVSPRGRTKESRICTFIESLYAKNYYLGTSEIRSAFVWQATQYKIGKKDNKDDFLDACAYGEDVRAEYWKLMRRVTEIKKIASPARVRLNNTPF